MEQLIKLINLGLFGGSLCVLCRLMFLRHSVFAFFRSNSLLHPHPPAHYFFYLICKLCAYSSIMLLIKWILRFIFISFNSIRRIHLKNSKNKFENANYMEFPKIPGQAKLMISLNFWFFSNQWMLLLCVCFSDAWGYANLRWGMV